MKYFLSILGLAVVVGFGYFIISNSTVTVYGQSSGLLVADSTNISVSGARVLALLNRLNNIKLDDSIFKNPIFAGLQDWTQPVAPQTVGRVNPYLPASGNAAASTKASQKVSLPRR